MDWIMSKELAQIKLAAYKAVYPKKDEQTPSDKRTWGQWFKKKFGEDIEQYHNKVKRRRVKNGKHGKK